MTRKLALPIFAALIGAGSFLAACNTMEGVGEDVQTAGEAIEDTAEEGTDNDDSTP